MPGLTRQQTLHATILTHQAKCVHWHNSGLKAEGVTNHSWLGPAPLEGVQPWYCKLSQKHMARAVTGPRKEFTTVALLNGCSQTTFYMFVYTHKLMLFLILARESSLAVSSS